MLVFTMCAVPAIRSRQMRANEYIIVFLSSILPIRIEIASHRTAAAGIKYLASRIDLNVKDTMRANAIVPK